MGASRFAQRQIERHRRLPRVADLCVPVRSLRLLGSVSRSGDQAAEYGGRGQKTEDRGQRSVGRCFGGYLVQAETVRVTRASFDAFAYSIVTNDFNIKVYGRVP